MKIISFILMLMFVISCATPTKLTTKGKLVEVLKERPKDCSAVARVVGKTNTGLIDMAQNQAINKAADEGGNSIYFDEVVSNGKKISVHATAYNCE